MPGGWAGLPLLSRKTRIAAEQKEILLQGLGKVLFIRKPGIRNFTIRVHWDGQVKAVFPRQMNFAAAEKQVRSRGEWIIKRQARLRERSEKWQENIAALPQVSAREAKEIIASRLRELADLHGFSFSSLRFRNQKTVWGSCSAKARLSLNLRLARLPKELLDYVLLHELTHTRVANHGPLFWREISCLVPDARELDRKLNEYPLEIF